MGQHFTIAHRDNTNIVASLRRRTERAWELEIPPKPDPDVLRLCKAFSIPYGRAKILKALSYGIAVDAELLRWCSGKPHCSHIATTEINTIRNHPRLGIPVRGIWTKNGDPSFFVIDDPYHLSRIRDAMRERAN